MGTAVSIDGRVVDASEARVSVFDRGFLYGDSVFETIRTYQGRPFALDEHLARLQRSAGLVYIPLPVELDQIAEEVAETLGAAGNPESTIRVMITRGQGGAGIDPAQADVPLRVIIVRPLVPLPERDYEEGVATVTFQTMRPSDATAAEGAKIGNYLVAVLGMRVAREQGAHEALIVDGSGLVVEGATSNVFFVEGARLLTPPERAGILPGITRAHAIDAARGLGIELAFESPTVARLLQADEVFISSSVRELVPVVRVDDGVIGEGHPGPITRRISEEFQSIVARSVGG